MVNPTSRPLYPQQCFGTNCIGSGWVPGPKSPPPPPTGIRSPDRPARSESLYRLLRYLIAFGAYCVSGNDGDTKRQFFVVLHYDFCVVSRQLKSDIDRLVLRFLYHTHTHTHTHTYIYIYTYAHPVGLL